MSLLESTTTALLAETVPAVTPVNSVALASAPINLPSEELYFKNFPSTTAVLF